jgi:hypothetical protein
MAFFRGPRWSLRLGKPARKGNWTPDAGLSAPRCGANTRNSPPPSGSNRSSSSPSSWPEWRTPAAAGALAELDIQGILAELSREGVDFLVIGGVAVGFHGHVRATKDVDVVPSPTEENLEKLVRVPERLEAVVEGADGCC